MAALAAIDLPCISVAAFLPPSFETSLISLYYGRLLKRELLLFWKRHTQAAHERLPFEINSLVLRRTPGRIMTPSCLGRIYLHPGGISLCSFLLYVSPLRPWCQTPRKAGRCSRAPRVLKGEDGRVCITNNGGRETFLSRTGAFDSPRPVSSGLV